MPKKATKRPLDDDRLGLKVAQLLMPLAEESPLKDELARSKVVTVELDDNGVAIVRSGDESASLNAKKLLCPLAKQFPLSEAFDRWERVVISLGEAGRPRVGYEVTESVLERPRPFKVDRYNH
jgi:hypothetical protein